MFSFKAAMVFHTRHPELSCRACCMAVVHVRAVLVNAVLSGEVALYGKQGVLRPILTPVHSSK